MWAYEIFIPIAIVVGIGLVLGLVLAVAAIILHVPVDERVEAVTEVLPGANCGACGYSGCSGYASALCEGSAENGLCAPGGPEVVQKISELLGGGAVTLVPKVAMVHCNEMCIRDRGEIPSLVHWLYKVHQFFSHPVKKHESFLLALLMEARHKNL